MGVILFIGSSIFWLGIDFVFQLGFKNIEDVKIRESILFVFALILSSLLLSFVSISWQLIALAFSLIALCRLFVLFRSSSYTNRRLFGACLVAHMLILMFYYGLQKDSPLALRELSSMSELAWEYSDQRTYTTHTKNVFMRDIYKSRYYTGTSYFILPSLYALKSQWEKIGSYPVANQINISMLFLTNILLIPITLVLICKMVMLYSPSSSFITSAVVIGTILCAFLLYLLVVPEWMKSRNHLLGSRRLIGLVFSPETVTSFFAAALAYLCLLKENRFVLLIGVIMGSLVILTERNGPMVAILGLVFFIQSLPTLKFALKRELLRVLGYGPLFAIQLFFIYDAFGSWSIRAGRVAHTATQDPFWGENRLRDLYGITEYASVSKLSWIYLPENFIRHMEGYLFPSIIFIVSAIYIAARNTVARKMAVLFVTVTIVTLSLHMMWINPHVTFRYNWPLLVWFVPIVSIAGIMVLHRFDFNLLSPSNVSDSTS